MKNGKKIQDEQKINEEFVQKQLKPYPWYGSDNKVYAKVVRMHHNKDAEDEIITQITLVSEAMLKLDQYVFTEVSPNVRGFYYTPYTYEFFSVINKKQKEFCWKISNHFDKWFSASLEIEDKCKDENTISGVLTFGASPFRERFCYLEFISTNIPDDISNALLNTYDTSSAEVQPNSKEFEKMKASISKNQENEKYNIRIYNVGQGNCIYIRSKNRTSRIMFDVGMSFFPKFISKDRKKIEIEKVLSYISRTKPDVIVLSHWDIDHIYGVFNLKDKIFTKAWIAPDINNLNKVSVTAARLAKYLHWKKKLYLIGAQYNGSLVLKSSDIEIYKGKGQKGEVGERNNFGLIISVNIDGKAILPGDCEYKMWPDQIKINKERYKYLVIPHHCSKMKLTPAFKVKKAEETDFAIISVGEDGEAYGHPNQEHIDKLEKDLGYCVIKTKNTKFIDIP